MTAAALNNFKLLDSRQAAALREIAVAAHEGRGFLLEEAGLRDIVGALTLAWLRIGPTPSSYAIDLSRLGQFGMHSAVYKSRRPRCRECGEPLAAGRVVVFGLQPNEYNPFGVPAFLHEEACS